MGEKIEFVKQPEVSTGVVLNMFLEELHKRELIKGWGMHRDVKSCIADDPDNIGRCNIDEESVAQLPITYYVELLDEREEEMPT